MNSTIVDLTPKVSFEQWTLVTQSIPFLVLIGFIWFFEGLVLYLIIAGTRKRRTPDGRKLKGSMLSHGNALIPIIIWLIQGVSIVIFLVFPFWLKIF